MEMDQQENRGSLLESLETKEDFLCEYKKNAVNTKDLQENVLHRIHKALLEDDLKSFEEACNLIRHTESIFSHADVANPFKCTNVIILACKYDKLQILTYIFHNFEVITKLFFNGRGNLIPEYQDENGKSAFYYAMRSGNVELLETLINKWPNEYFLYQPNILDRNLSQAWHELKLRNIFLDRNMEIFVQEKLIDLRFSSLEECSVEETETVWNRTELKEWIMFLVGNIESLSLDDEINDEFLYKSKTIVRNIRILKKLLKSTYNELPWDEIEFCFMVFISPFTKIQEFYLYYHLILTKEQMVKYLHTFSTKLKLLSNDFNELNVFPKVNRDENISTVIGKSSQFTELYETYNSIRDVYSLEKMNSYIKLALNVNFAEEEGHLVILRSLQVIGENFKNTLESPKLSKFISERLLLSLAEDTRKVILEFRDLQSYTHLLIRDIENVISPRIIQDDLKEMDYVIDSILYKMKMSMIKIHLQKLCDSRDRNDFEQISVITKRCLLDENSFFKNSKFDEYNELEYLFDNLESCIFQPSKYEKEILDKISSIIKNEKNKFVNMKNYHIVNTSLMKKILTILNNSCIDENAVRVIKNMAHQILQNINPNEIELINLREIAELVLLLPSRYSINGQSENLDKLDKIMFDIFYFIYYKTGSMEWIHKVRSKLREKYSSYQSRQYHIDFGKEEYNYYLEKKSFALQEILNAHFPNNPLALKTYRTAKKSKVIVEIEMLVLDILSILKSFNKFSGPDCSLLDNTLPVLLGEALFNYLAYDDITVDFSQSDILISLISNAKKLVARNVTRSERNNNRILTRNISNVKDAYVRELDSIRYQEKMFKTLAKGDFEELGEYIRNGADIFARNIKSWTTLHFSAIGRNVEIMKFLLSQGINVNSKNNNKQSPLHITTMYGNNEIIKFILDSGYLDVNEVDNTGETPLHIAAQYGYGSTVDLLLKYKARTNIKDLKGYFPLHHAIEYNHMEIVNCLLIDDPNSQQNQALGGFSLLHIAAERGHLNLVNFLLKQGADFNARTDSMITPLHLAVLNGHLEVTSTLLLHGADVNATNIHDCTPLLYAIEQGHENLVDILLERKADPNISDKLFSNSPLHYAVKNSYVGIVKKLLNCGANPNARTSDNVTPLILAVSNGYLEIIEIFLNRGVTVHDEVNSVSLYLAIQNGHYDVVDLLIKYKADIDGIKSGRDFNDMIPIQIATFNGRTDILNLLLKNRVPIDVRDTRGNTLLHLAAFSGNRSTIEAILEKNFEINVRSNNGLTPIHIAAKQGLVEIIDILIRRNAKINVKCTFGFTPLHLAVMLGHVEVVSLLIRYKANVNIKSESGMTALHIASERGYSEIVKILIKAKGKINVKNNFNLTPLTHAIDKNRKEIVQLLLTNGADVNSDDGKPIMIAIKEGYKDIVNLLLENDVSLINRFPNELPLLFSAIRNKDTETTISLIKNGADVNCRHIHGTTPLYAAIEINNENIVEILLKNGANVNFITDDGLTPLLLAITRKSSSNVVKILLEYGADVNIKDIEGKQAIELAIVHNSLEHVKILSQRNNVMINEKVNNSYLIHIAAQEGHLEIVKFLVDRGTDMHVINDDGSKPIHIAAREGHKNVVEFFINQGISVHESDEFGKTSLHYTAFVGHFEVAHYLLEHGAKVNVPDVNESLCIHVAAKSDNVNYVKFLLKNGAFYDAKDLSSHKPIDESSNEEIRNLLRTTDELFQAVRENNSLLVEKSLLEGAFVNAKSTEDVTPLYFAAWRGYLEVLQMLLENSANPNLKMKKGLSPLHYASKFSHLNIIKSLLTKGAMYNIISESGRTPASFANNNDIVNFFEFIDESFKRVVDKDTKIIDDMKKIKDIDIIRALMGTVNLEKKSLIFLANQHNFPEIEQLRTISQSCLMNLKNSNVDEKTSETERSIKLTCNMDLAEMLLSQEKYAEALKLYRKILEERKRIFGSNNLETLDIEDRIAAILFKQQQYDKTVSILKEIYAKRIKLSGINDPSTLNTRSILALVFHRQGKNEEALSIYREIHEKQKEILDVDHNDLLNTQAHMVSVLTVLKRLDEALRLNNEIYEIHKRIYGPYDPKTLITQNNKAMILSKQGKFDDALEVYEIVCALRKKILGPSHFDTIKTLKSIIGVYVVQKKYNEAICASEDLFDIQKTNLGPNNVDTLNTQYKIAKLHLQQGNSVIAIKMLNDSLPMRKAILGPDHPDIIQTEKMLENINSFLKCRGIPDFFNKIAPNYNKEAISKAMESLLENNINVNYKGKDGGTLLHFAVESGHIEIVNLLLKNGASVVGITIEGITPLHIAIYKGRKDIAEILLENLNGDKLNYLVNARTTDMGTTSLHIAAKYGYFELVKFLLKNGAIYNIADKEGETALDLSKNCDIINFFMLVNNLFDSTQRGDEGVITEMKKLRNDELKAITNTKNYQGKTILQVAVINKHKKIANEFLITLKNIN